jgi:hypothetical protein
LPVETPDEDTLAFPPKVATSPFNGKIQPPSLILSSQFGVLTMPVRK